jgi:hypothetical protein
VIAIEVRVPGKQAPRSPEPARFRFLHHCDVITINGPSWRMKNQKTGTGTDAPAEETVP